DTVVTYCGEMKHNRCFCMCLLRLLRLFLTTDFVHIIKKIKKTNALWWVCNKSRGAGQNYAKTLNDRVAG
ncbi:hypothetical protein, partial [Klebsiella pneumoniae]|uniref:hypothetical protein n=1 Tax=Klebsiella pneumoniae TaxID=573 RepID=UPI001D0DD42B